MQSNLKHSEGEGVSGDLPTPPFRHPSEEGIFTRKLRDNMTILLHIAFRRDSTKDYGKIDRICLVWRKM